MKIDVVLRDLHERESDLHAALWRLSETYRGAHEIHHIARDVARWSREHLHRIAEAGRGYGLELATAEDHAPSPASEGPATGEARTGFSMNLLADLREVYLKAAGVAIDWEILSQSARALREEALAEVAGQCRAETVRQRTWLESVIKAESPQIVITA